MKKTLIDLFQTMSTSFLCDPDTFVKKRDLSTRIDECYDAILENINEEDIKKLNEYENCHDKLLELEGQNSFVQGFSFAVKLIFEALK